LETTVTESDSTTEPDSSPAEEESSEGGSSETELVQVENALLDTCIVIDLTAYSDMGLLPKTSVASAVTFGELTYGISTAKDPMEVNRRSLRYATAKTWFTPLPFDLAAAERYGELTALVLAAGRQPRPRRMDLMIAAIAVANKLPLVTANPDDYKGLEEILDIIAVPPLP
jgi:predicted nucleic acid-binding protein